MTVLNAGLRLTSAEWENRKHEDGIALLPVIVSGAAHEKLKQLQGIRNEQKEFLPTILKQEQEVAAISYEEQNFFALDLFPLWYLKASQGLQLIAEVKKASPSLGILILLWILWNRLAPMKNVRCSHDFGPDGEIFFKDIWITPEEISSQWPLALNKDFIIDEKRSRARNAGRQLSSGVAALPEKREAVPWKRLDAHLH